MPNTLGDNQIDRTFQPSEPRDRALLRKVIEAQEMERGRIARELHDATGQVFTSMLFGLRAVIEATSLELARSHAQNLHRIASQALEDVQRLARGLRPSTLDDFGLVPALKRLAEDYRQLQGLDIRVKADQLELCRFPSLIETTAYRVAQEALTNVVKHARANAVTVSLDETESLLSMTILDNGQGFDPRGLELSIDKSQHLGLSTMRERTLLAGGRFSIESAPGRGTSIFVELPSR